MLETLEKATTRAESIESLGVEATGEFRIDQITLQELDGITIKGRTDNDQRACVVVCFGVWIFSHTPDLAGPSTYPFGQRSGQQPFHSGYSHQTVCDSLTAHITRPVHINQSIPGVYSGYQPWSTPRFLGCLCQTTTTFHPYSQPRRCIHPSIKLKYPSLKSLHAIP